MNIFATSPCPIESAKYLDDKRAIKMALESAQMLSTAINEYGGTGGYKSTHVNHPANVWARTTRANYMWLVSHFSALCSEYTLRYGKVHKCAAMYDHFLKAADLIPDGDLTPFVNCAANNSLGVSYKFIHDTHEAYRLYLASRFRTDKRPPTWHRQPKAGD